jgi:hypothetical protein
MAQSRRSHRQQGRGQAIHRARRMRGQARARAKALTKTLLDEWDEEGVLLDEPPENSFDYSPALFHRFPHCAEHLPWISLRGALSPAVPRKLSKAQHLFHDNHVFMKEESSDFFLLPEHEARKLEFILGQDEFMDANRWVSLDDSRSEHALSVAKAAQVLAKDADVIIRRSTLDSTAVQRMMAIGNLGAVMRLRESDRGVRWTMAWLKFWSRFFKYSFVPEFSASGRGALGYVSAMFEIDEMVAEGRIPVPDFIFVPLRSGIIQSGLEVGRRILGWNQTTIIGVPTLDQPRAELAQSVAQWANEAWEILKPWMPYESISKDLRPQDFQFDSSLPLDREVSPAIRSWIMRFMEVDLSELEIEGAGRALWALSQTIEKRSVSGKSFLFWNTTCPFRKGDMGDFTGYQDLPKKVRRWIREDQRDGRLADLGSV